MKDDIKQIKQEVSLLRVAAGYLKLEQRGGEYWACCPFHNEKTASFAIKDKNGELVFFCQGCGKGGDVIRFVEYIDNCTTKTAIEKLRAMCGDQHDWSDGAQQVTETFHTVADKPKRVLKADTWPPYEKALQSNAAALKWLKEVRGITVETAAALRLGYSQECTGTLKEEFEPARKKGWILFPRFAGDKILAVKMRGMGAKAFSQATNMDGKALFNADTVNELEPIFVTEGEFDAVIMEQAGFRSVSMPNATTKLTPENKLLLKRAPVIFLAGDNDGKSGNAAMRQLQRELGANTFILLWPDRAKDANEFFLKRCSGNVEEFITEVENLMKKARATPIEGFTSLLERLRNTGGTDAGADPHRLHFPIEAIDKMNYNPPGSVVVVYSTYTGTGKTVFVTQIMLYEAKRGEVVVVYSPELRDEQYLALVAAQTIGPQRSGGLNRANAISRGDYEETAQVLDVPTEAGGEFTYYVGHSLPEQDPDKVLDFLEHTIKVTGATRLVVDTLHRIIERAPRESQSEAEGRVIKRLEQLGIKYGTIFILIGQSNKEAEDLKEERRDSHGVLRGSRELMDVPYGVYLLHRKRTGGDERNQVLDPKTELILKKDRGKGPGNAVVHLAYRAEVSKFYEEAFTPATKSGKMSSESEDEPQF